MSMMVFVSYADGDERLWKQLETRLAPRRVGSTTQIELWNPHKDIVPGQNRKKEIKDHVRNARLFLLLLSSDYFVDEECMQQMEAALARKQQEGEQVNILPILLRPCDWENMGLEDLEILPRTKVPISESSRSDAVLLEVSKGIQETINYIDKNNATSTPTAPAPSQVHPVSPQPNPAPAPAAQKNLKISLQI